MNEKEKRIKDLIGLVDHEEERIKQFKIRIQELEEGIEGYLGDPEFDTDILTKLIKKEKL